uniref:40S ribosomal protein S8 n=1 Tax=Parastrongyloides trichosuri TaxID=131310 RepID=A0A0N4ZE14_PARTI
MGIARDSWHKRRATGGKRQPIHKKRKFELGRPNSNTKIGAKRVHNVRCRGGAIKYRALRLDNGSFAWGSEGCTRKTRIVDTVYNASNNELVRTKSLVKGAIITIDAVPFRQWYESHYATPIGRKKGVAISAEDQAKFDKTAASDATQKKYADRQKKAAIDPNVLEQFSSGRLLARIASRPGQSGRADGYILEGKELEFYLRKIRTKKAK